MNRKWIVLGIILVLALGLRIPFLGEKPFSLDEPHSVRYLEGTFPEMLATIAADYRNPLYYSLLWGVSHLGGNIVLRAFSVLLGLLTVVGIYVLGKTIFNERVGMLSALLLALSTFHIGYSQYVREYSLLILLFTFSLLFFHQARLKGGRFWILLTMVNSLMLLTHILSFVIILSQLAVLLLIRSDWKVLRLALLQLVIVGVAFAPWLLMLSSSTDVFGIGDYYEPFDNNPARMAYVVYKFSIGVNISGFMDWFSPLLFVVIPFVAGLFFLVMWHFYRTNQRQGIILFTQLLAPIVLLFLFAYGFSGSFGYRYLSPLVVLYLLMIAAALTPLLKKRRGLLLLALVIGLYVIADVYYFSVITLPDWPARFGI